MTLSGNIVPNITFQNFWGVLLEYRTTSWQTTTDKEIYVHFSVRAKVKAISSRVLTKRHRGVLVWNGDE